eukprot:COSAG01_NODE_11057_length_2018_cov_2.068265_4_plen_73_part_01
MSLANRVPKAPSSLVALDKYGDSVGTTGFSIDFRTRVDASRRGGGLCFTEGLRSRRAGAAGGGAGAGAGAGAG